MGWGRVGVVAVGLVAIVSLGGCAVAPAVADKTVLVVQIVPGAEWVEPQLESSAGVTSIPLTVPGATNAAYRCDAYPSCWADAIIDHSWVQVSGVTKDLPDAPVKLTKSLTALATYRGTKWLTMTTGDV